MRHKLERVRRSLSITPEHSERGERGSEWRKGKSESYANEARGSATGRRESLPLQRRAVNITVTRGHGRVISLTQIGKCHRSLAQEVQRWNVSTRAFPRAPSLNRWRNSEIRATFSRVNCLFHSHHPFPA